MAVFAVPARVRLDTVGAVESAGLSAIASGTTAFSFAALDDLDSSSVAVLLSWKRAAARRNAAITWHDVPGSLTRLAHLYGVDGLLGLTAPPPTH
jgi:phospholipid transport system transporter-binding protein